MSEDVTSAAMLVHDRLIQDNQRAMDRVFEELSRVNVTIGQVRERMAALEAANVQPQVAELRSEHGLLRERVAVLEGLSTAHAEVEKTTGRHIELVYRFAPWLFLTAFVVYNALAHSH